MAPMQSTKTSGANRAGSRDRGSTRSSNSNNIIPSKTEPLQDVGDDFRYKKPGIFRMFSLFRPWEPSSWPSIKSLTGALLFVILARYSTLLKSYVASGSWMVVSTILLVLIIIRAQCIIKARRERLKVFDKGKVPSVGSKSIFSGNLFQMIAPVNSIHIIDEHHKILGKSFGIFYGPDPWVFTIDLDLIQKLFISEGSKYVDITQFRTPFDEELTDSIVQIQGDKWRRLRRVLDPSFTHRQMKSDNVFREITEICNLIMDCLAEHPVVDIAMPDHQVARGKLVDCQLLFMNYTLEVIFRIAFGCSYSDKIEPNKSNELVDCVMEGARLIRNPLVWAGIMFDEMRVLASYLVGFTKLGTIATIIHKAIDESLKKRSQMDKSTRQEHRKMIDTIMESFESQKLDNSALRANLFFFFLAGLETSANTLVVLFWFIARHQDKQDKLRQSVLAAGEESKYLHWFICETLRLYPAVPGGVGRIIHEDLVHNGHTFYAGTTIVASVFSVQRCKEYWGDDHLEFKPERFEQIATSNEQSSARSSHPAQFFAFGHGPRRCIGASLAMAEMRALVARIIVKYRIDCTSTTPQDEIDFIAPNLIHMIFEDEIKLCFTEISSL